MSGRLADDGTRDTVIECKDCGQQARYNFDSAPMSTAEQTEAQREEDYRQFVEECIKDFNDEHECGEDN